jgi:hypothetical protein
MRIVDRGHEESVDADFGRRATIETRVRDFCATFRENDVER